jgi:hypothetical protein
MDDSAGAELEADTARSIAVKVDSPRLMQRCEALEAQLVGTKRDT